MKEQVIEPSILDKIAENIIRIAVGFKPNNVEEMLPSSLHGIIKTISANISREIVKNRDGILSCGICGKGPYTRKGLYLHIKRMHMDKIVDMLRIELEEELWRRRKQY